MSFSEILKNQLISADSTCVGDSRIQSQIDM